MQIKRAVSLALFTGAAFSLSTGAVQAQNLNLPNIPDFQRKAEQIGKEALKGAVIGYAVKQSAGPLNQFINAATLRNGLKDTQATKVVPILSLGDKGYIGGAQVSGPQELVNRTQAVWQVEGSKMIGDGVYRAKALVPSNSLNPLKISRVERVGITALIDVATGGPLSRTQPQNKDFRGGDVLKAGAIAVAVNAAARPINDFVNTITFNRTKQGTKVVPLATFGEKAYVGAGQLSGTATALPRAKALWMYEDLFDRGRFRVRILVPTTLETRIRRVPGVGLTAIIDTTIQRQAMPTPPRREPERVAVRQNNGNLGIPAGIGGVLGNLPGGNRDDRDNRDNRNGQFDQFNRFPNSNGNVPPGWSKGKKNGWYKNGKFDRIDRRDDDQDDRKKDKRGNGRNKDRDDD